MQPASRRGLSAPEMQASAPAKAARLRVPLCMERRSVYEQRLCFVRRALNKRSYRICCPAPIGTDDAPFGLPAGHTTTTDFYGGNYVRRSLPHVRSSKVGSGFETKFSAPRTHHLGDGSFMQTAQRNRELRRKTHRRFRKRVPSDPAWGKPRMNNLRLAIAPFGAILPRQTPGFNLERALSRAVFRLALAQPHQKRRTECAERTMKPDPRIDLASPAEGSMQNAGQRDSAFVQHPAAIFLRELR